MTILASVFIIASMMFSLGLGTMAYFSDVEMAIDNQITAGTLDMMIRDFDEDWTEDPVSASMSSPHDLKPGEEFWTDVIKLRNVGTLDAQYVYVSFGDLQGIDYLTKRIVLMEIWEYSPNMYGVGDECTTTFDEATANAWLAFWNVKSAYQAPLDGDISLHDIVYCGEPGGGSAKTSFKLHTGDDPDPLGSGKACALVYPYLPTGGVVKIKFKFKLLEETGNAAQGESCTFDVKFIASNCLAGADLDGSF